VTNFWEEYHLERFAGYTEIDGDGLYYEVDGAGDPLVFVHAGVADSRMWEPQFALFARHFRVLRYDLRGFGRSPVPDGSFATWRDLAAVLDRAGIQEAHIVGASFGGAVAIDFALMMKDRVRSLVLAAPAVSGHAWSEAVRKFGAEEDAALEAGDLDRAVELNLRMWVDGPGRTPDQVDPTLRIRVGEMQRRAFEASMGEGVSEKLSPPAIERLGEISVPVLVVVGDGDVSDIDIIARTLEQQVRGARRVVLPGAAHLVSLELADKFNELALNFLMDL
jgi:3-oxoadipate enol-lactonase